MNFPFQAVKRRQIADEVAEQLQRKIAAGEWNVGTKIPTEPELMKLFESGDLQYVKQLAFWFMPVY